VVDVCPALGLDCPVFPLVVAGREEVFPAVAELDVGAGVVVGITSSLHWLWLTDAESEV